MTHYIHTDRSVADIRASIEALLADVVQHTERGEYEAAARVAERVWQSVNTLRVAVDRDQANAHLRSIGMDWLKVGDLVGLKDPRARGPYRVTGAHGEYASALEQYTWHSASHTLLLKNLVPWEGATGATASVQQDFSSKQRRTS